jgi:hypothetical protein
MRDNELTIAYDHYKDTFSIIERTLRKRDVFFIRGLLLFIAFAILTITPDFFVPICNVVVSNKLDADILITYSMCNSTILFVGIWYWIRYYQNVLQVEVLYKYIHALEDNLSLNMKLFDISREGKTYLNNYHLLKSFIHHFYQSVIPFLLLLALLAKGWHSFFVDSYTAPRILKIFDTIGICVMIFSTVFYMIGTRRGS